MFEKALKIENSSELIIEVTLRKFLFLKIKKTKTNKTFKSKLTSKRIFFWRNLLKQYQSIGKEGLKCFRVFIEIKHTEKLFLFLHISLAIHRNHEISYSKYFSYKIYASPIFLFWSIVSKKHI